MTQGERTVLVDPYYSRPGKLESLLKPMVPSPGAIEEALGRILGTVSAVIVGHTHSDHALDIPELARRFPVPFVGSASLATLLSLYGMNERVTVCRGGERGWELPGGDAVTMLPSRHGRAVLGRVPLPGEISQQSRVPPPHLGLQTRNGLHAEGGDGGRGVHARRQRRLC